MIILGISHPMSWNNAACLLIDGQLVAMVEEERLNRQKHAPSCPPILGVEYCLETANLKLKEIDCIAVGFGRPWEAALGHVKQVGLRAGWRLGFYLLRELLHHERAIPGRGQKPILFFNHHLAHAASTYFVSGFEEAMIISLDGSGGGESGILAHGKGDQITILERISNDSSWGLLYEEVTELLGFRRHSAEGKTMGLAAYCPDRESVFSFIDWNKAVPTINIQAKQAYLAKLKPRKNEEALNDEHKYLAALVQNSLERAATQMVQELQRRTGSRKLCLAGGTALNCSMNGVLGQLPIVDDIFIQPAAHDAGSALGAALLAHQKLTGQRSTFVMKHPYWGPEYPNAEILAALQDSTLSHYHLSTNIVQETAKLLAAGKIVGWFQGRAEIGPRALGSRSILAHPGDPTMKDRVNLKVKKREPWRPFAPSILEEFVGDYLLNARLSPFMLQAFTTRPERCADLCSAIHVDASCRPQTVSKKTNLRYWQLIDAFRQLTGIAAVLNTSFNIDSQTIVCRPAEAIWTFLHSDLEAMAIGDYVVLKKEESLSDAE